jgi:hypothetical protein
MRPTGINVSAKEASVAATSSSLDACCRQAPWLGAAVSSPAEVGCLSLRSAAPFSPNVAHPERFNAALRDFLERNGL